MAKVLTAQADDFPRWYQDVLSKAQLAENGPVRGTMVIRPYGYAIWERMQADVDGRIKAAGAENAYFPRATCSERPTTSRGSAPSWRSSPTRAARPSTSPSSCAPPARR
jgi:prolyl-tRNA synthetase